MKQNQFLEVADRDEAERRFRRAIGTLQPAPETIALGAALGRVLAEDIASPVDVPGFDRSNMDGYAVAASDTFGASEAEPVRLRRSDSEVAIGCLATHPLGPGEAMPIPTGGALPRGADAVVMVEHTELDREDASWVTITRAATPGAHVASAGSDIARGEVVLRRGELLSSRETGVLAAIGLSQLSVIRKPRVAIISTGDELVPPGAAIEPGQIFDSNAVILADAVRECGGDPISLGIVADEQTALDGKLREALQLADVVLLSGGTSKGPGDLNVRALERVLSPPGVVVHGVALRPGKPLCLAVTGKQPVVVLPGFPTSAVFTFHEFVAPLLREMAGARAPETTTIEATLPMRVNSDPGRTEYNLVRLVHGDDGALLAFPIGKGSGSVTTWAHADGYFVVPRHREHVAADQPVTVHAIAGSSPRRADLVIIGSHCIGLDIVVGALNEQGVRCKVVAVGSEAGLTAARRGHCDVAPIHLMDEHQRYNQVVDDKVTVVAGYGRRQSLLHRAGDTRFEGKLWRAALDAALADPTCRMINRNAGSGTRMLIDQLLGGARPPGYSVAGRSHHAVAAAIAQGRADYGVAIDVVARDRLAAMAISDERFDFAVPVARRERPAVRAFVSVLNDDRTRARLLAVGLHP